MLLSGSFSLTTAKAQNRHNFRSYDRSQKAIITYDAKELIPIDTTLVRDVLHANTDGEAFIIQTPISNEEVFELMEEEELMREMQSAPEQFD